MIKSKKALKDIIVVGKRVGDQVYYRLDPPFKEEARPLDCYPNCLTALISIYDVLYESGLGAFSTYKEFYEAACDWFNRKIKEGYTEKYVDYTNRFLRMNGIDFKAKIILARKSMADDLDLLLIKNELLNFSQKKLVPPIAVIDEHYLRHGQPLAGAHSLLLLGYTIENFFVYDPDYGVRIREVSIDEIKKGLSVYDYNLIVLIPVEESLKVERVALRDTRLTEFPEFGDIGGE
ncbi:hypothetical protein [Archaeoglobus profundus]|uniref:Peptidase C39-like domain-containing protein n=1 Tax=Archaeoglobus profundus (strain DSM 5631 / JCM 9629 / NBRC 100127 / Av18) TaxID=572546 RepID=D2RFA5_ARCPA|nr:hypothetical protein [Archaeoglobus profundus]ADB58799.1 hypothetical protein Arcpr_1755 [Archaeoglobus profundus DSM 5631]